MSSRMAYMVAAMAVLVSPTWAGELNFTRSRVGLLNEQFQPVALESHASFGDYSVACVNREKQMVKVRFAKPIKNLTEFYIPFQFITLPGAQCGALKLADVGVMSDQTIAASRGSGVCGAVQKSFPEKREC